MPNLGLARLTGYSQSRFGNTYFQQWPQGKNGTAVYVHAMNAYKVCRRIAPLILNLSGQQAGFRKGYVVGDRIVNVRWVMGRVREHHKNVCCINYSNALDSAEHFKIGNITNMGVLVCLIVLIQDIYTKQEGKVEFEQDITKWFPIQKGVRQGCVIWPFSNL